MKKQILFTICAVMAMTVLEGCSTNQNYVTKSADISETFPIEATDAGENPQTAKSDGPYAIFHTTAGDITVILYPDQAPETVAYFISLAEQGYYNGSPFDYIDKDNTIQAGSKGTDEEKTDEEKTDGEMTDGEKTAVEKTNGEMTAGEMTGAEKSPAKEYDDGLHHFPGALAMAGGKTDAEKSQFYFIVNQEIPEDQKLVSANLYMNELVRDGTLELNEKNKESKMSEEEIKEYEDQLNQKIQSIGTEGVPENVLQRYQTALDTYMKIGGAYYLDYKSTVFGQVIKGLNVAEDLSKVHVDAVKKPKQELVVNSIEIKDNL
ncbi:peptidylprolyl isomerase [Robinsoniella peoriensis]|uniref:peptidylprolyl isomerase n=1 Tax=Robinsoniella peoriensis TaxID=180332 RepID=A0A4V6HRQ2_9FIRM|nr:peptidylprolyl isomerase [Robinsoniella peoriensis]MDU7028018.1 peptidylprolyl isomerase [Clostridiales bacterium]TLC99967.1 putative bifunctional phosphatase/peptidyl-prolyl cis-trans isomerase [Robinsoniella peoriensis]